MRLGRRVLALLGLLLAAAPLAAHRGPHPPGTIPVDHGWDFTLATLDGDRFVTASSLTGPVLVNFWAGDCAPCIAALPRLQAFAKAHPQWTVLLVAIDAPPAAREALERHGISLATLRPGANVSALMRSAGNRQGTLPFTVGLRHARLCEGQFGDPAPADLARIAARCAATGPA
jgi:thiol-disulfide isomerase/thioredoxin